LFNKGYQVYQKIVDYERNDYLKNYGCDLYASGGCRRDSGQCTTLGEGGCNWNHKFTGVCKKNSDAGCPDFIQPQYTGVNIFKSDCTNRNLTGFSEDFGSKRAMLDLTATNTNSNASISDFYSSTGTNRRCFVVNLKKSSAT